MYAVCAPPVPVDRYRPGPCDTQPMPVSVASRFDDPLAQAPGSAVTTVTTSDPPVESGSRAPATGSAAQPAISPPGAPNRPDGSDRVNAAVAPTRRGDQAHAAEPAALPPAASGVRGWSGTAASASPLPAGTGGWAGTEPAAASGTLRSAALCPG